MCRSLPAGRGGVQAPVGVRAGSSVPPPPRLLWFALVFGLGMMEIGLIIVIAVMLFPPTELPKLVRSIARIYGQVRRTAEDFRNSVLEDEDLRQPIDEIKGAYNDARWEVRDAERKARQQLAKAQMDMRMATARRLQAEREAEAKAQSEASGGAAGEAKDPPKPAARAASAGPVRIAASNGDEGERDDDDDDDDEDVHGPIAGSDPRVLSSARRPSAPAVKPEESSDGEPREGVA